jgi:hypothetical protein
VIAQAVMAAIMWAGLVVNGSDGDYLHLSYPVFKFMIKSEKEKITFNFIAPERFESHGNTNYRNTNFSQVLSNKIFRNSTIIIESFRHSINFNPNVIFIFLIERKHFIFFVSNHWEYTIRGTFSYFKHRFILKVFNGRFPCVFKVNSDRGISVADFNTNSCDLYERHVAALGNGVCKQSGIGGPTSFKECPPKPTNAKGRENKLPSSPPKNFGGGGGNGFLRDYITLFALISGILMFVGGYGIGLAMERKRRAAKIAGLCCAAILFIIGLFLAFWITYDDGPLTFINGIPGMWSYLLGK